MLTIIMGTIAYILISACEKLEDNSIERAYNECEETDWNEQYDNM